MINTSLFNLDSLIHIVLPRACLLCRTLTREKHHLCQQCDAELPILSHSCDKCAQFLHLSERKQLRCGSCLSDPPPYDKVYAIFPYEPPLRRLIAGLKFEEAFSHAHLFSQRLLQAVRRHWYLSTPLPDLILPMPLHQQRLLERGYNQATEIAKPVAKALSIPLDCGVIRSKATLPQSTLTAKERRNNLAQAFTATRSYVGQHVAVIDDVMTTGQTVATLARLLKAKGAKRVDIWCIARCDQWD